MNAIEVHVKLLLGTQVRALNGKTVGRMAIK